MAHMPSDERRQQFIQAAAKVIREEGLAKATTRRIAQEAGAPLASLHYCFKNKEELFVAVSQTFGEEGSTYVGRNIVPGMGVVKAIEEILGAFAEFVAGSNEAQIGEFEFYAWAMRTPERHQASKGVYALWTSRLAGLLSLACAGSDNEVDRDVDVDALGRAILALTDGFSLQVQFAGEDRLSANMSRAAAALVAAVEAGVYRTTPQD
jgi:AcrR family transcriptional regulator